MSHPVLRVKPKEGRRARMGSPWIFSNEIAADDGLRKLAPGALVEVALDDGTPLGPGFFNPKTLIAVRLLAAAAGTAADQAFFEKRIRRALTLRTRQFSLPFYRLVHAEADLLPGLVIDRYDDVLSVQAGAAGMDARIDVVISALQTLLKPRAIVLRNDFHARTLEGLESYVRLAAGEDPGEMRIDENGAQFFAHMLEGQKTGWFFDQRENRRFAAQFAKGGAMLDAFSHSGGFALAALKAGASEALCIDASERALALAARAGEASSVAAQLNLRKADVFEALEDLAVQRVRFPLVVADPPAFAKTRKDIEPAARAYRKLARAAAAVTAESGTLVLCSCSHHIDAERFLSECAAGITQAKRQARLLRASGADCDHPVHPHLPETAYLKCLAFALD